MSEETVKLKDILSISGKPGLFKFLSQGRNSIIVESFMDKKRLAVQSTNKVSALEDIAIYTEVSEVALREILSKIYDKEKGGEAISHKSSADELKSYFGEILPDYDRDRVYVSDIKKVINWYNILISLSLLNEDFLKPEEEETTKDKEDKEGQAGKTKDTPTEEADKNTETESK